MKHMERFKTLLNLAIKLEETIFTSITLEKTMDIFLFACYTGLSYVDVKKLSRNHLVKGIDGRDWIHYIREKSQTSMKIPLLRKAKTILD